MHLLEIYRDLKIRIKVASQFIHTYAHTHIILHSHVCNITHSLYIIYNIIISDLNTITPDSYYDDLKNVWIKLDKMLDIISKAGTAMCLASFLNKILQYSRFKGSM